MPEIGEPAPDFVLPGTGGEVRLSELNAGKKVVLAFYQEDSTPGCTTQLSAFKEEYPTLRDLGAAVIGISADSLDSHQTFCDRQGGFPFPLAADQGLSVARAYDVLSEDGKRSRRAVYIINERGIIIHKIPWYQPGNVGQFLEVLQALGLVIDPE